MRWGQGRKLCNISSTFSTYIQHIFSTTYKGSKRCSQAQGVPKRESFLQLLTGDQQVNWFFYQDWETSAPSTHPSRLYGATRDPWARGWPGPERSGVRVQHPNHRDPSQFHNNNRAAAGLLSQRLASQEGKTGACKFWILELEKQMEGGWNEMLRQKAWSFYVMFGMRHSVKIYIYRLYPTNTCLSGKIWTSLI